MYFSFEGCLAILGVLYPVTIFAYYIVSSLLATIALYNVEKSTRPPLDKNTKHDNRLSNRRTIAYVLCLFLFLHLAEVSVILTASFLSGNWPQNDFIVINHLSSLLVFGVLYGQFLDSENPTWFSHWGAWAQALVFEIMIASLMTAQAFLITTPFTTIVSAVMGYIRCILLGRLLPLPWTSKSSDNQSDYRDDEHQALLSFPGLGSDGSHDSTYGSIGQDPKYNHGQATIDGARVLLGHVWSTCKQSLRFRLMGVAVCLLASSSLNVLIPRQTGIMMDSLNHTDGASIWLAILSFITLRMVATDFGISFLSTRLWEPVRCHVLQNLSNVAFTHIMNLSADFHESKNSCTLNSALQSATSVTDLAESAILEAAPLIIDLVLAFVYLTISLGSYEGFTIVATGVVFFVMTKRLLISSERHSRRRLKAIYDQVAVSDAALRGWHTSCAFGQIGFEENRHADAITSRWLEEQGYTASWGSSRATQAAILTCGFSITAFLATVRVKHGQATPGKLAMLLVYWSQLMGPLKLFSAFGQRFADRIVDAELLLQTMQMTPSVENHKIARPLKLAAGHIQFDNICFQYGNGREILKGLILQIPAGSTTAFVGSSGGGLSTILKLVSRFYDVTSGAILIDGQDIRNVDLFRSDFRCLSSVTFLSSVTLLTKSSLRQRVGLVPQQILLFNDTIMNNIRYAKVTASDVQVLEACKAAYIHDTIINMPQGTY